MIPKRISSTQMIETNLNQTGDNPARRRIVELLPTILTACPAILIPAAEWIPGIPQIWRAILILTSLVLGVWGIFWSERRTNEQRALGKQVAALRTQLDEVKPENQLHDLASGLFTEGAWRVSVWKKLINSNSDDFSIKLLVAAASDNDSCNSLPEKLAISSRSNFASFFSRNLARRDSCDADESDGYRLEDDVADPAWSEWRNAIFGTEWDDLPIPLRPRKFAWMAAKDPDPKSGQIVAVIVESTSPNGIRKAVLDESSTRAVLMRIARTADLQLVDSYNRSDVAL